MTTDVTDLSGLVAVVTGAAAGLGRAEAIGLARAGATVVVNDIAGALDNSDVVDEITTAGSKAVAVAGDHVLPHITPSIGFEPEPGDLPLGDFLQSLAIVRAMPDMRLLPAHGPVTDSSHRRVDELVQHHDDRLAECHRAAVSGLDTAAAVAAELPWTRRRRTYASLDPFNQMLATIETMAVWHTTGVTSIEQARRQEVVAGASGRGASAVNSG